MPIVTTLCNARLESGSVGDSDFMATDLVLYVTYTGLATDTNGVSTQVQITLDAIASLKSDVRARTDFRVAFAEPIGNALQYSPDHHKRITELLKQMAIEVDLLSWALPPTAGDGNSSSESFWNPEAWDRLSGAAVEVVHQHARKYRRVMVLACDLPLSGLCAVPLPSNVGVVYLPMSLPLSGWESIYLRQHLARIPSNGLVRVATFGKWVSKMLTTEFSLNRQSLIALQGGVPPGTGQYCPMELPEVESEFKLRGLSPREFSIAMVTRLDPRKGIDIVLRAVRSLGLEDRLLLVAPNTHDADESGFSELARSSCCQVKDFSRGFARAVFSSTIPVFVFASRDEVLPNVVFEAVLQSRHGVVVVPNSSGYVEQVAGVLSAITFSFDDEGSLADALGRALALTVTQRSTMRMDARMFVIRNFDFRREFQKFVETWTLSGHVNGYS